MNRPNVYKTIGELLRACYLNVTITLHWALGLLLLVTVSSAQGQTTVQRVMCGGIQVDTSDRLVSAYKVEAALALALELTNKYQLIPNSVRDSVGRLSVTDSVTVQKAADRLGAEIIIFSNLGRIGNLVRMEIVVLGGTDWILSNLGVGYAVSFYERDSSAPRVLDPAILQATQRALCRALVTDNLYDHADSSLRTKPTELIAIGGFEFVAADADLAPWSVFLEKVSASYDIAQTAVASLRGNNDYTVVDMDSRDSIYALAGLFMVENYNVVSSIELSTLKAFDVRQIITGSCERKRGGAELTLVVNNIQADASYTAMRKASVMIPVDSKLALQDGVRECLRKLFGTISEPRARKR